VKAIIDPDARCRENWLLSLSLARQRPEPTSLAPVTLHPSQAKHKSCFDDGPRLSGIIAGPVVTTWQDASAKLTCDDVADVFLQHSRAESSMCREVCIQVEAARSFRN